MQITGHHLIAGAEIAPIGSLFQAAHTAQGTSLEPKFGDASAELAHDALLSADAAFDALRLAPAATRAAFLETLADEILALGDTLLDRAHAETALPMARLTGERGRAMNQCKMFAALLREGSWLQPSIDRAQPDRQPVPKPDVRKVHVPLGPVVVFGASNFPFAIGVVGTDTVCALAAGCPVVVKGHPAHPGTCELLARAVYTALLKHRLPAGAFSLLQGRGNDIGIALTKHPLTQAVAFTGSLRGGRALFDVANARPHPIPVYAEMGSVNPVFLLPGALKERGEKVAEAYVASVNMGVGQFCTNPAIVLGLKSPELDHFASKTGELAQQVPPASMLHRGISEGYEAGTAVWHTIGGLELVGKSATAPDHAASQAACRIFKTTLAVVEANEELQREVFGPCSIITECADLDSLLRFAGGLEGQLTAALHGTEQDLKDFAPLVRLLERKVGRIIFNGFGTGIEPCPSMHHGGPYPAATHSFFTSIGTDSIYRFVRPVSYQGFPDAELPEVLQNANPTNAMRLVDGTLTREPV
jgi:alpha-ketoglutaric semialdehyde dehydrogenase